MQTPTYNLPGSLFFILTGQTGNGKDYQIERAIRARVPGTVRPAVAPTLLLITEASSEGTSGRTIADPSVCLNWGVRTFDDAIAALRAVFPEGRPPLTLGEARRKLYDLQAEQAKAARMPAPPKSLATPNDDMIVRSVAVSSISTLHEGQCAWVRERALEKAGRNGSGGGRDVDGKNLANDRKRQAGLAAGPAMDLVNMLSGLTIRHRGTLVLVACHTRPQTVVQVVGDGAAAEKVETVVGEAPHFGAPKAVSAGVLATGYAALWHGLAQKANAIWHCYAVAPNLAAVSAADVNAGEHDVKFGVVTQRGTYAGLGYVGWAKRQGGEGWAAWIDAAPRMWQQGVPWRDGEELEFRNALALNRCASAGDFDGGPHLGAILELCIARARENAARA